LVGVEMMQYLITFAFIVMDFVTGIVKGFATHTFKSSVMREGLYHKIGLIMIVALGVLVDYAQGYLDIGVTVPVAGAVCAYICLMEIGSGIENICKINPEILPEKVTSLFLGLKSSGESSDKSNGGEE
jgi:phage-related holin